MAIAWVRWTDKGFRPMNEREEVIDHLLSLVINIAGITSSNKTIITTNITSNKKGALMRTPFDIICIDNTLTMLSYTRTHLRHC